MTTRPSRPQTPPPPSSQAEAPKPAVKEPGKPLPKQAQQEEQGRTQQVAQGQTQQVAQGETQQVAQGETQQVAQGETQQVAQGEFGEGNYKASRDYNDGVKRHLETHDVEKEARDAAPHSRAEAQDMERAEEAGRAPGLDDVESVKGGKHA